MSTAVKQNRRLHSIFRRFSKLELNGEDPVKNSGQNVLVFSQHIIGSVERQMGGQIARRVVRMEHP